MLGTSTPLYTALLAASALLGMDIPSASIMLGILATSVTLALVVCLAWEFHRVSAGIIVGRVASVAQLYWNWEGMETQIVTVDDLLEDVPPPAQGPEAVIPLDRLRDFGGGVENQIIDQRPSGDVESQGGDGRKKLQVRIKDTMKSAIGRGEFDRLVGMTYGLGRVPEGGARGTERQVHRVDRVAAREPEGEDDAGRYAALAGSVEWAAADADTQEIAGGKGMDARRWSGFKP